MTSKVGSSEQKSALINTVRFLKSDMKENMERARRRRSSVVVEDEFEGQDYGVKKDDLCVVFPYDESQEGEEGEGEKAGDVLTPKQIQDIINHKGCDLMSRSRTSWMFELCSTFKDPIAINSNLSYKSKAAVRETILRKLSSANIRYSEFLSLNKQHKIVAIGLAETTLCEIAEITDRRFQMTEEFEGGWVEYRQAHRSKLRKRTKQEWTFFCDRDRINLSLRFLELPETYGGLNLHLQPLVVAGIVTDFFPLHSNKDKQWFLREWAYSPLHRQPLEAIKDYLGERIALYFAWLEHYTSWLALPAILSVPTFFYNLVHGFGTCTMLWCAFITLWSTAYLDTWRLQQSKLSYEWGTNLMHEEDQERPEFYGVMTRDYRGKWVKQYPKWKSYTRFVMGIPIVLAFITAAIIATIGIMLYREMTHHFGPYAFLGAVSAGMLNAGVIGVGNAIYRLVADMLTKWENHRTVGEHEDHLIFKTLLFTFVNSYSTLFYIAFMKQNGFIDGDYCRAFFSSKENACIEELSIQLASIFITQFTMGNIIELGYPLVMSGIRIFFSSIGVNDPLSSLNSIERQSVMEPYPGLFEDYSEMVIQFGYVALFSAAFPPVALLAFINNFFEIRLDAYKIVQMYRRPMPHPCRTIGSWYPVLKLMGYIAVSTNAAIYFLTTKTRDVTSDPEQTLTSLNEEWFRAFMSFFWVEHALVLVKVVVDAIVPEVSPVVKEEWQRRNWFAAIHSGKMLRSTMSVADYDEEMEVDESESR